MAVPSKDELARYAQARKLKESAERTTPEQERARAFAEDVSTILSRASGEPGKPAVGALLRVARTIGFETLDATLATTQRYTIAKKPPSSAALQRRRNAIELMLAEKFVREVLFLTDELGNRRDALFAAQEEVHPLAMMIYNNRDDPQDRAGQRKWANVVLRGLERRFEAMAELVRSRRG